MVWWRRYAVLLLIFTLSACAEEAPAKPVIAVTGLEATNTRAPEVILAAVSFSTPTPPPGPILDSQTPTPVLVPTYTPTNTIVPTATGTPLHADDSACYPDLQFFMVSSVQGETQLTIHAHDTIEAPNMEGEGWVDFGGDLEMWVNEKPATDIRSALFDPRHPERLYILSKMVKPGYRIQIRLYQPDGWHCAEFTVPLPVPPPTPTIDPEASGIPEG